MVVRGGVHRIPPLGSHHRRIQEMRFNGGWGQRRKKCGVIDEKGVGRAVGEIVE